MIWLASIAIGPNPRLTQFWLFAEALLDVLFELLPALLLAEGVPVAEGVPDALAPLLELLLLELLLETLFEPVLGMHVLALVVVLLLEVLFELLLFELLPLAEGVPVALAPLFELLDWLVADGVPVVFALLFDPPVTAMPFPATPDRQKETMDWLQFGSLKLKSLAEKAGEFCSRAGSL